MQIVCLNEFRAALIGIQLVCAYLLVDNYWWHTYLLAQTIFDAVRVGYLQLAAKLAIVST